MSEAIVTPRNFRPDQLRDRLNADPEFALRARWLTTRLQVRTGTQVVDIRMIDGSVVEIRDDETGFLSHDILVESDPQTWAEMMQRYPRPFYQDFWSAMFHHGVRIEGDLDLLSAYYAAVSRMGSIMRDMCQEAGR